MIGKYWLKRHLMIMVGASGKTQPGFISVEKEFLDITKCREWWKNFLPGSLSVVLAEHVIEHIDPKELCSSLKLVYKFLETGGRLRIAIPDKNRRDKKYVDEVKPPHDGHRLYLNVYEITNIMESVGFYVKPLEYYNSSGKFIYSNWDLKYGKINRSAKYDRQSRFKRGKYYYTSLILDAFKR